MADKKIQIEILDFESGDSLQRVDIVNGGEFIDTPIAVVENGSGQATPTTNATVSLTTSGTGTLADPFIITGVSVTSGGSGYNSTIRIIVTTSSGGSGVITTPILNPILDSGVLGQLDISDSQDFPLSLTFTVSDGKNLESRFGDFSKSFDIPATKNNNRIFNHIYNPLVENTKNIYHIKNCRILVDSVEFFRGKIQLQGSKQDKNPKSYSCTIYGGNFSWVNEIKDKRMCDLEFNSTGAITFDYDEIVDSFDKNYTNSQVIYPLVSYGDFNITGTQGAVNIYKEDMPEYDWRGWFWVYNLLKEIFKNIGYTIDSSFIETANFKKLITHFGFSRSNEDALNQEITYKAEIDRVNTAANVQDIVGDVNIPTNGVNLDTDAIDTVLLYNTELTDPVNGYDTSTGVWTCKKTGYYKISAVGNFIYGTDTPVSTGSYATQIFIKLLHKDSSGSLKQTYSTLVYGDFLQLNVPPAFGSNYAFFDGATVDTSGYVYVQVNETFTATTTILSANTGGLTEVYSFAFTGLFTPAFTNTSKFLVEYDSDEIAIGDSFTMQQMLPCDIKQIDFIKGISHMFNLQFYTDVQSKKVYIEPYNDFYGDVDTAYNWSSKVDYSQGLEDKYEIGLKEEVLFKYKNDSNDKYMEYLNKDDVGNRLENPKYSYYLNLGDSFPKGKLELTNPLFAPTQQTWDNDARKTPFVDGLLIPVMWTDVPPSTTIGFESQLTSPIERPDKGFDYEPRILYYTGHQQNPNNSNYSTGWTVERSATSQNLTIE